MTTVIQIGRHEYIHVLNENKVVTRLVCGPSTFIKKAHERIVKHATKMIEIPPMHYCRIQNPVVFDGDEPAIAFEGDEGEVQVKVKTGEEEIRFNDYRGNADCEPFPLYPGEKMIGTVKKQAFIPKDTAYLVQAIRDFTDDQASKSTKRVAGA